MFITIDVDLDKLADRLAHLVVRLAEVTALILSDRLGNQKSSVGKHPENKESR